jgi:hypothetical protein
MDLSLLISIAGNIILFLLLVFFVVFYFTTFCVKPNICPSGQPQPQQPQQICTDPSCNYVIKTLDGKYLSSYFSGSKLSVVASDKYSGETVQFISSQNGLYQIKMNIPSDPMGIYLFNVIPETITRGTLSLTKNQNDRGTIFNLIPYVFSFQNNSTGSNLYQIGTPISNTLLGEGTSTCNTNNTLVTPTKKGVPIIDGFNFYVNAPNGLSSKSLFLILPSRSLPK